MMDWIEYLPRISKAYSKALRSKCSSFSMVPFSPGFVFAIVAYLVLADLFMIRQAASTGS